MKTGLEIERKFFVSPSTKLTEILADHQFEQEKRYYFYRKNNLEIRITQRIAQDGKKGFTLDRMELQATSSKAHSVRKKDRIYISEAEYLQLEDYAKCNPQSAEPIIRNHYHISDDPKFELKVYARKFEGLVRAEVEFASLEEAEKYIPLDWFGQEITDSPVGRDTFLPDLSQEEFQKILKKLLTK